MEIINLDMTPSTVTPNAHAGQYDSARTVRFMLKNGGVPFTLAGTETITAEITRPDNTEVTVDVANTSSNYVDVVFDDTVCTVKGLYACELREKDGDVDIGSQNFALIVQRDPYDGTGVHAETVGPADICTFETTLPEPLQSVTVNVLATGGNGTPDNPNPINGYTEANITRCGKNLYNGTVKNSQCSSNGSINLNAGSNYAGIDAITPVLPNTQYSFALFGFTVGSFNIGSYDVSGGFINRAGFTANVDSANNAIYGTFTTGANTYGVFLYAYDGGGSYSDLTNAKMALALGNYFPNAYTPYNGQTYTIAFGQTVYGGVLDVTRGKLKPCIEYPSYNGETLSGRWLSSEATYVEGTTPPTGSQVVSLDDYGTDIDLTPVQISALALPDSNNVFADCGQTELKYLTKE